MNDSRKWLPPMATLTAFEAAVLDHAAILDCYTVAGDGDYLLHVITRDVEDRYRGFLGSAMLELAPGVYAQPRMSAGVRTRIWTVVEEWHTRLRRGSIVMCWAESAAAGGLVSLPRQFLKTPTVPEAWRRYRQRQFR